MTSAAYRVALIHLLLGAALVAVTGCTNLPKTSDFSLAKLTKSDQEEPPVLPDRILAIWKDTVLHQQGKPAQRGFGGRVFFYQDGDSQPIEIEGAVTVYAFDATDTETRVAPEKKFVFPAESLHKHYSKCSIGHSYSFWLPWDQVGGETRQISLITRFAGTHGGVLISEPAKKLLPGISKSLDQLAGQNPATSNIVSVPLDRIVVPRDQASRTPSMETHTIGLPTETATRFADRQSHEVAMEKHLSAATETGMLPLATTNNINPMRVAPATFGQPLRDASRPIGSPPYQHPAPWQSSVPPVAAQPALAPGRLIRPPSPLPRSRPDPHQQVQAYGPNGLPTVVYGQNQSSAIRQTQ